MRLTFLSLYPPDTLARYLLSSYVLAGYAKKYLTGPGSPEYTILNIPARESPEEIAWQVGETHPDIISFSCYIWNIEKILEVLQCMPAGESPPIRIFGGPEITIQQIRERPFPRDRSFFIIGEGERRLTGLLRLLGSGPKSDPEAVPAGIAFWEGDKLRYRDGMGSINDLDEIPSIYLDGVIDPRLYHRQQAFLETQRGCRFRCRYCVYHKNLSSIAYYSLDRVYAELDHLILKGRVHALRIFDAIFTSDLARAKKIVSHLVGLRDGSGAMIPWIYWEFTVESVDEEFLGLVSRLKTRVRIRNSAEIRPLDRPQLYSDMLRYYTAINCIGVQSFDPQALKSVGRVRVDRDRFARFMGLVEKYNLVLKLDLILGLPFETMESYLSGLDFVLPFFRDTDHVLNLHRLQVLPGTELEGLAGEYQLEYSRRAPHLVSSTNGMSVGEMREASRLSALLFRMVNSPLRGSVFATADALAESPCGVIRRCLAELEKDPGFRRTALGSGEWVDDTYWNENIFREVTSGSILSALAALRGETSADLPVSAGTEGRQGA